MSHKKEQSDPRDRVADWEFYELFICVFCLQKKLKFIAF